ncbi:MAG: hypothetical protein QOG43_3494 [Actinomycetota bacterium]|jgi:hypothetical protein|nr:hypothetical protein [Actinomycetota bacterium]
MGFLDKRRERKAAAIVAQRQETIVLLEWMIDDSQSQPGVDVPGFEERRGERTFAILSDGVALIEPRRQPGTYRGRSSGSSIRVFKGFYVRSGGSTGTFVPGQEIMTPIDIGTAFITNQRVVFRGEKATREWAWSKLISLDHSDTQPLTRLPVSNRQKTSGLLYDNPNTALIRYRLQQGLAHYHGTVNILTAELRNELASLKAQS